MTQPTDIVRGGTERNASTIELFFDLVYVFAITQVVGFIHGEPTFAGLGKGAFLLFVLWWTWSIYTWTTNWSGTASTKIRLFLLATMATTLVMAMAVPRAFDESSALFGTTFFAVRMLAAGLYWFESKGYEEQRAAFMTFFPGSVTAALLILVGGFTEGATLAWLFALGGAGDVISALYAGRGTWAVDAPHFAERNGLFIIIALGESVVGIGLAATGVDVDVTHLVALIIAFVGVATLWWAYFDRAAPYTERRFSELTGQPRGRFARDVYTLLHYPLVVGIVMYAVGLEDVIAHPVDLLNQPARVTIASGTALVLASIVGAKYRALRLVSLERLIAAMGLVTLIWVGAGWAAIVFAGVTVGIAVVALSAEALRPRAQLRQPAII